MALTDALHRNGALLPFTAHKQLLAAYDGLNVFPDVPGLLLQLSAYSIPSLIFSNGTPTQISTAVCTSHELQDSVIAHSDLVFVSVHDVCKFKPAPETYLHLLERLGVHESFASEVVLVSSNPFDIAGAAAVGLSTVWVDREAKGWGDGLGRPSLIVKSLQDVVGAVGIDSDDADGEGDDCF